MITFNLSVEQVNVLINALNQPLAAGTVTLANLISMIHEQIQNQLPKEGEKDGE
jgi:hypothetical protein